MEPEFTIISPMYNVSRYLPEYFASLERQTYGFDRIEVILVDDGSTDDTAAIADEFAARHPNVRVIRKENGGQASARNVGIGHATGTWLTFPDPDDVLSEGYFAEVASAIDPRDMPAMLSTRLLLWYEKGDVVRDTHALAGRFREGRQTKDLLAEPSWIQPHVTSGFVQRSHVSKTDLVFPENLRLRFEDGSFVARYLLDYEAPRVTFVPEAEYLYRQRSDNSSTIQSSAGDPRKYTDTIRHGFLPVIDYSLAQRGTVPCWLQNLFLYDQFWILRASQSAAVRNVRFPESMYDELDELLPAFLKHVDDNAIARFNLMYVAPWMREALLLTKHRGGHGPVYHGGRSDPRRGLRSIVYRYRGRAPLVGLTVDGVEAVPHVAKAFGLEYAARPIVMQQVLWVPDDAVVELSLDGEAQAILDRPDSIAAAFKATSVRPNRAQRILKRTAKAAMRRLQPGGLHYLWRDVAVNSKRLKQRFANAWVFIDRDVDAGDSAEDMYWWMAEHHPEHNSWFVVREGTADWKRMSDAGARLVGYGTPSFYALLRHADHLASSHADRFITHALPPKMRPPRYAFTFLQHGVIKGDISHWLNPKDIQVFVASTPDEYRYLTESSAYRVSRKEVRLTGLPRFDVLLERADAIPDHERNIIAVMPTWRNYLVGRMGATSADRTTIEDFTNTEYAARFSALLHDERVLATARDTGCRIVFMPHPNMQPYLSSFPLPDSVEVHSYADTEVRDILARARLVITDYSSIAFNAAYIRTPVMYYQFDRDHYLTGHTERPGYFDYHRDGFGPVADTAEDAGSVAAAILLRGADVTFTERMQRAFPVRDGRNRERVYEAMLEARTTRSLAERASRAPADSWRTQSA